jgi:phage terminase small subunit
MIDRKGVAKALPREGMTARQQAFVREYLVDLNGTQAAIRAGYSKNCAQEIACENLTKPIISNAVKAEIARRKEEQESLRYATTEEMRRLAFSDMGEFVTWDQSGVKIKSSKQLGENTRCVSEVTEIKGLGTRTLKFKLHDKVAALDKLARHLGMYEDAEAGKGSVQIAIVLNGKDADL